MSKQPRQTRRQRNARKLAQRSRRTLHAERLEDRMMLTANLPYHNASFPVDVNTDGVMGSGDALAIINDLNLNGARALTAAGLPAEGEGGHTKMIDVDGDNFATPSDVRRVINALNAEGEAGDVIRVQTRLFRRPANYPFVEQLVDHDFNPNTPPQNALVRVFANEEIGAGTNNPTIGVGQEFVVKLTVEDIRMTQREGVFSVYADVNFNGALASVVENLPKTLHPQSGFPTPYLHDFDYFSLNAKQSQDTYARSFGNYGSRAEPFQGSAAPVETSVIDTNNDGILDQIDTLGSFSSSTGAGPGPGEFVLVEWVMRADAAGNLTIVADPTTDPVTVDPSDAGHSPLYDPGIFGQDAPVCPSVSVQDPCMGEIDFVSNSITIVDRISAVPDFFDVNEDAASQTLNVLANDVNNTSGTLTIVNPLGAPSLGGTVINNGNSVTYTPAPDVYGIETFTYTISNGLGDSSSATVTVDIAPINDGPINSVPGPQTIDEDNDLVFSGGALSVSDVDADAGSGLSVGLSVSSGTITVTSGGGATIGTNGTGNVTINGTVSQVNNALNGLTYSPNLNFNGSDALRVNTSDNGNFGSGGTLSDNDTVNITINPINDGPINTVPGPQILFNTDTLSFGSGDFAVQDVDASTLEVNLTVSEGTLSLGNINGLQVTGNNSDDLTAVGSIANLNNALGSLLYDPDDSFIGFDTLTMTTTDNGQTGGGGPMTDIDTVSLQVTPPELPFAASDFFAIEEDPVTPLTFSESDLLDNDLAPDPDPSPNTLTLNKINDICVRMVGDCSTTTPNAGPFTTAQGGSLTFNVSTGGFSYAPSPDFFGTDTFTYTIESSPDEGDGPSTGTVNIDVQPINDGPINSVPGPLSVDEDNTLSFSGANLIDIEDIDAGAAGVTVTLTVGSGTINVLTGGGGTVTNNGTGTVSIDGTVSQVNNSLAGLTYSPNLNFNGSDTLTITTNDNGNTGGVRGNPGASNPLSDTDTVDITIQPINDPPTIIVPGKQTFITDFDNFFSAAGNNAISIDDVDAGSDDVQVDLLIGNGTLTLTNPANVQVSAPGTNNGVRITGTVSNINSALGAGVKYRTSVDGFETLTATVNDLGNNGGVPGNPNANNPLSATESITIEVLDFVPSNLGGFVYIDSNNDANKNSREVGLEGVKITLNGTTFRNTPVALVTFTDRNGAYLFPGLEPGNYTLGEDQPVNLKNGTNSFHAPVISSGVDQATVAIPIAGGIFSLNNNFGERGLAPPFASMYDLLDSQFQRSSGLLSTDGETSWNTFLGDGWTGYSNLRVNMLSMTLTVKGPSGDRVVDLRANDPARHGGTYMDRVILRKSGDNEVYIINGTAADFGLASNDQGGGEGGEGEFTPDPESAATAHEMYAQAVDQVFGEIA